MRFEDVNEKFRRERKLWSETKEQMFQQATLSDEIECKQSKDQ